MRVKSPIDTEKIFFLNTLLFCSVCKNLGAYLENEKGAQLKNSHRFSCEFLEWGSNRISSRTLKSR